MSQIDNNDQEHTQNIEVESEQVQNPEILPRRLNWVDLIFAFVGIVVLYFGVGLVMSWLASWWEQERILLYANGFVTQGMFLVIILAIRRMRKWTWRDLGWRDTKGKYAISVLALYILTWIINIFYAVYLFQSGFTPPDTDIYTKLLGDTTIVTFILNLILAGILAPIIEETMFRGIIFGSLQTYMGKWTAAGVSAAFFSALHLQSHGFIPRFVLGMVLAYLVIKHNSIKPAVALHAVNNIVAVTLVALSEGL